MSEESKDIWNVWDGRLWILLSSSFYLGYAILFAVDFTFLSSLGYLDKIVLSVSAGIPAILAYTVFYMLKSKNFSDFDRNDMANKAIATSLTIGTFVLLYDLVPKILSAG